MLTPASTLNSAILALAPSDDKGAAITAFVAVIAEYMNQVQGGSDGTVGILTVSQSAMYNVFITQAPVADSSWINTFAEAWYQGVAQGTITPGTVTNSAWSGGSTTDTETQSTGMAVIANLATAQALLTSELAAATYGNNPALPFATAVRDATLACTFTCIGLDSSSNPQSVQISAE